MDMPLSWAESISFWANWTLIGALVVGVVATLGIVVSANVKETHWQKERKDSNERISANEKVTALAVESASKANAEIEKAKVEIAKANKTAAEANERAVTAALELEKYRAPRKFPEDIAKQLALELKAFEGTLFAIAVPSGNREAEVFAEQIESVLLEAKWTQMDWSGGDIALKRPGKRTWGLASATGVLLLVDEGFKTSLEKPALALGNGLKNTGFAVALTTRPAEQPVMVRAVRIIIGQKP